MRGLSYIACSNGLSSSALSSFSPGLNLKVSGSDPLFQYFPDKSYRLLLRFQGASFLRLLATVFFNLVSVFFVPCTVCIVSFPLYVYVRVPVVKGPNYAVLKSINSWKCESATSGWLNMAREFYWQQNPGFTEKQEMECSAKRQISETTRFSLKNLWITILCWYTSFFNIVLFAILFCKVHLQILIPILVWTSSHLFLRCNLQLPGFLPANLIYCSIS